MEKIWENVDGSLYNGTLPASITVKLQRREGENGSWVEVKTKELTAQEGWKCNFTGLDRYSDISTKQEYQYRVVELDEKGEILAAGNAFGCFKVSYGSKKTEGTNDNNSIDWTVTNTYIPLTAIKVIKVDAADRSKTLSEVEFKLEKISKKGASPTADVLDEGFGVKSGVTGEDGVCIFGELKDGIYRLTETKAAENHSLLKSPVYITIDRVSGSSIDGRRCNVENDTITITIANSPKFDLPATGSWSRLILGFGGGILIGMAVIMYLLQKRRKGVKTS